MSEQKPSPVCTFCNRALQLYHVMGNIYTCQHCAERHKLKLEKMRKVEAQPCACGVCSECKQRAVKEARVHEDDTEIWRPKWR